jgi:hypothetical protein
MQARLGERHQKVVRVPLDGPARALEQRIRKDSKERSAEKWRLDHVESYEIARS